MPTVRKTIVVLLLIILSYALTIESVPADMLPGTVMVLPVHVPTVRATAERPDVAKIISVLERGMGSRRLPKQAKEKLERMPEKDLRLVASLCDWIAAVPNRAGTDFALLLAAVLIVLS